jgi:uncharacterized SAM-binding protein YcdF (DUF218 family)
MLLTTGILVWSSAIAVGIFLSGKTRVAATDAVLVLGAAVRNGKPSPALEGRLRHALDFFGADACRAIILTGAIGHGDQRSESAIGRDWLMEQGVPANRIFIEEISRTTRGNLRHGLRIARERGFEKVTVISDPLHLFRARLIGWAAGFHFATSGTPHSVFHAGADRWRFAFREWTLVHAIPFHWMGE